MVRWDGVRICSNLKTNMLVSLAAVTFVAFASPAAGVEFAPYNEFTPYESPQLQPFSPLPPAENETFAPYAPGPTPPNVQMPEYQEKSYGAITPPKEPDVQMQQEQFQQYNTFKPLPPVREGPIRGMQPFDFHEFKPLGEE